MLIAAMAISTSTIAQTKIYLSPDGNDLADGSQQHPLKSLTAARDKVRAMPPSSLAIEVMIAPGEYYMTQPLVLTPEDNQPVIFRAADTTAAKPKFIGGFKVEGWQIDSLGRWKTKLPLVANGNLNFEQLWVNNRRATRARTPNTEWWMVESSKQVVHEQGAGRVPAFATQIIKVKPEELSSLKGLSADEAANAMVMYYHKWDVTRKPLSHVVADSGLIFNVGTGMKPWNAIGGQSRYILENYLGALDVAGEWYLDRQSGELYYMPRPGESIENSEVIAPTLRQLIAIEGTAKSPITNKQFVGLNFSHSSYIMPTSGNEPMQAAAGIEAAIMADYAHGFKFTDCEIEHTGAYGIWLRRGCKKNTIEQCYIADLGAGGIKVGDHAIPPFIDGLATENVVNNNIITHAGYVFPCGVGVAIMQGAHNRISHNEIADIRYSGVSVGWYWGYNTPNKDSSRELGLTNSPSVGNIVEFNNIHHIGWGELSDMGAVYTLGESPGTVVRNNVIHDIYSYDYGGWGLYTDEGSTDVTMENNLVYGCKSGGFHQHYGKNNRIRNNIFAFSQYFQLQLTRAEKHRSLDFTNNIILADCGITTHGAWDKANVVMDRNMYWDLRPDTIKFSGRTFEQWKKIPRDVNSIVADPMFRDAANLDFTIRNKKAIKKIGFTPFNYSKAGVYGSELWIERAKLDPAIIDSFEDVIRRRERSHSRIYNN